MTLQEYQNMINMQSTVPNLGTQWGSSANRVAQQSMYTNPNTYGNMSVSTNGTITNPRTSSSGFSLGNLGSAIEGVSGALNAVGGLANAYIGYQNYKMAKEQYGVERDFANRNLSNSAILTNNAIDSAANLAYHLGGKSLTKPSSNTATRDAYMAEASTRKVDGSAI